MLRRGHVLGAREIGMLAACGIADVEVFRRPRVAVLSTGDELVRPGEPLGPAQIYDSNGPIVAAALAENGCEPVLLGAVPDDAEALEAALRDAPTRGRGGAVGRHLQGRGRPHLSPHRPARRARRPGPRGGAEARQAALPGGVRGKPVVVLPGFPTSAMFTFHDIVAPVLRTLAGQPAGPRTPSRRALRCASRRSWAAPNSSWSSLIRGQRTARVAFPNGEELGIGLQLLAGGRLRTVDAMLDGVDEGETVDVTLLTPTLRVPDLVIVGSHCVGLEPLLDILAAEGVAARSIALGSLAGLAALRRGECDVAPIHLMDPATGSTTGPICRRAWSWFRAGGACRLRFRAGDARFAGRTLRRRWRLRRSRAS